MNTFEFFPCIYSTTLNNIIIIPPFKREIKILIKNSIESEVPI